MKTSKDLVKRKNINTVLQEITISSPPLSNFVQNNVLSIFQPHELPYEVNYLEPDRVMSDDAFLDLLPAKGLFH